MYHIKDDKRSKTSAGLVCNGLMRCLERKSFSQITITDVQKESCVGRATFYRLFDGLSDVLTYQCDRVFQELPQHKMTAEESFIIFMEHWMCHYTLLETIIESNHIEILYEAHRKNAEKIKGLFFSDSNIGTLQMEYISVMLTSIMTGVLTIWARNDRRETAHEIFEIVQNTFMMLSESFARDA